MTTSGSSPGLRGSSSQRSYSAGVITNIDGADLLGQAIFQARHPGLHTHCVVGFRVFPS